ncbi:hypothetical protein RND81_07G021300 [Saponaria officinalis]|uniref:Uncharacterized protein n=1 Tax=Saponaria officinalis TaxID=3572 RepID=A0AAW1JL32_SAPOF
MVEKIFIWIHLFLSTQILFSESEKLSSIWVPPSSFPPIFKSFHPNKGLLCRGGKACTVKRFNFIIVVVDI